MQALAGSGFLMGICCPPRFLMSTPCNQPCKTQGGELLLINVRCLWGKWSGGSAGKISIRGAAAQLSMAEVHTPTCVCPHTRPLAAWCKVPSPARPCHHVLWSLWVLKALCSRLQRMIAEVQKSFLVINTSCVQRRPVVNGGWSRD